MLREFDLHLYRSPDRPGLHLSQEELSRSHFKLSFEQAVDRFGTLQRMYVEMDGSFVWTGEHSSTRWQVDGMLYDINTSEGGKLQRIEVKGSCPSEMLQQLLTILGWPEESIVAHRLPTGANLATDETFVDAGQLLLSLT